VRVQLGGFLVDEKRHWHTPAALARHAPVGAVLDHRFQARAPPAWKKFGLFDRPVRQVAQ